MKPTFLAALLLAVRTASLLASPAATQDWVRDYVATHASTNAVVSTNAAVATKVATVQDSIMYLGTNYTFTLALAFATEPALKVVTSTVTGMPAGVRFAMNEYGDYCNYTNLACDTIYKSVSTNWTVIALDVTNVRNVVQLDFRVNGVDFRGFEDPNTGLFMAAGISNETGIVTFRRTDVTPRTRRTLTTPPAAVGWLDLLVGRACAAWTLGEWVKTGENADGGDHYEAHYYWDGEPATVDVGALTVGLSTGGQKSFDLGVTIEIPLGSGDACGNTVPDSAKADADSALLDAILEKAEASMTPLEYKLFLKLMADGKFSDQITDAVDDAFAPYTDKVECPAEYDTPGDDDDGGDEGGGDDDDGNGGAEVNPLPTPTPPANVVCAHATVYCASTANSCVFRCASCKKILSTGDHSFEDAEDTCARCGNAYRGVVCGRASQKKSDHYFGYGGTEDGCRCKHGRIWPHGPISYVDENYRYNASLHWRLKECQTCGYDQIKDDIAKHTFRMSSEAPTRKDDLQHSVKYVCSQSEHGCEFFTNMPSDHVFTDNPNERIASVSDAQHKIMMICTGAENGGCGAVTNRLEDHTYGGDPWTRTEKQCSCIESCGTANAAGKCPWQKTHIALSAHQPNSSKDAKVYETVSSCTHNEKSPCVKTVAGFGSCGYLVTVASNVHCSAEVTDAKIVLSASAAEADYVPCDYCPNGKAVELQHNWNYTDKKHWCVQGSSLKHLEGSHTFVGNVCSVCGYAKDDGNYEYAMWHADIHCSGGNYCCLGPTILGRRRTSTNGVEIAEADRGDFVQCAWYTEGQTCRYLDYVSRCCKCPYCRKCNGEYYPKPLLANECYCKSLIADDIVTFLLSVVSGSYYGRYSGTGSKLIDFSYPVYEIGDDCFENAFQSMPNLIGVNASAVTNVGNCSFQRAFQGSGSLADADFSGLVEAGYQAFLGAFAGCGSLSCARFGSLVRCGSECFEGAFAGTIVESLDFASLKDCGGPVRLFGSSTNVHLKTLAAPKLDFDVYSEDRVFEFATMPALETLDLSGVSLDVANALGDLSSLTNLVRIDFHSVTGIPNYAQSDGGAHAPTNNPNCMIVVPDGLWEDWCRASGWRKIENQIVPYSNQVIRPKIVWIATCAADPEFAEAAASTADSIEWNEGNEGYGYWRFSSGTYAHVEYDGYDWTGYSPSPIGSPASSYETDPDATRLNSKFESYDEAAGTLHGERDVVYIRTNLVTTATN